MSIRTLYTKFCTKASVVVHTLSTLWTWIKAHLHFYTTASQGLGTRNRVRRVLAVHDDGNFKDITHGFDPAAWEAHLEETTGWKSDDDRWRVEVRYVLVSPFGFVSKYRMVLRRGDVCIVPEARPAGLSGPRGILSATLIPRQPKSADPVDHADPGDPPVDPPENAYCSTDITRRVIKYGGPAKDFHASHGLSVRALEMFPYDDPDQLCEHFFGLRIVDAQTCCPKYFPFETNQPLA